MRTQSLNYVNYDVYLFSCLLKNYNDEFRNMPYDEQFQIIPDLYKRFSQSGYDNPNKSLYECMIDYLSDGNWTL